MTPSPLADPLFASTLHSSARATHHAFPVGLSNVVAIGAPSAPRTRGVCSALDAHLKGSREKSDVGVELKGVRWS